jgi:hypothetical protein
MSSTQFNVGFGSEKPSSRVIQAPGGASSNIFGSANGVNGSEGSDLNSIDSGSLSSLPSTPINGINGSNGSTNGHHFFGDAMSECSTPPSSASSSRRGSRQEDTKNRLFGPEVESPRRRVVDRMKSNIFSENTTNGSAVLQRSASVKKYDHVIRRNPITGEVYDEPNPKINGHNTNGINGKVNGVNNGSASLPTTPVRVRQPPGGKCSGIFS